MQEKMRIVVGILILFVLILCIVPTWPSGCAPRPKSLAVAQVNNLCFACREFRHELGCFPTGTMAQVCQALTGSNQQNLVFDELPPEQVSSTGAFLDPWGTEYQIEFAGSTGVVVRSAGKDRAWGTKDDIARQWVAQQSPRP